MILSYKIRRLLSSLTLMLIIVLLVGCSKTGSDTEFTVWLEQGEDSTYYANYEDNPSLKYWLETFHKKHDDANPISFDFYIPAAGTQQDNFNTLIATGDYTDIMRMSFSTSTVTELYDEGIAMDITYYVENYMPNYVKFLDENPEYKKTAMNYVDGKWRYLSLWTFTEYIQEMFQGYTYRRDWIIRFGDMPTHIWDLESSILISNNGRPIIPNYDEAKQANDWRGWKANPNAGQPFVANPGNDPYYDYQDNVIFPSGGENPYYLSDWEWMFRIFDKAHQVLNITNSYHISIPYTGFLSLGDFYTGLGGGGPMFYLDGEDVKFGGTSDQMRLYLQIMNKWYNNGWLDKTFNERSSELFFQIDQTNVRRGRIGMWKGNQSTLGNQMDLKDGGLTEGIMAFGAAQPINDMYGTEANKMKTPDTFYQFSLDTSQLIITNKAKDKDLVSLFRALDYICSPEGGRLVRYGLNKEQIDEIGDTLYAKFGMPNGAYSLEMVDGVEHVKPDPKFAGDRSVSNALKINRFFGLQHYENELLDVTLISRGVAEWDKYRATGSIRLSYIAQMNAIQGADYNKINNNLNTFFSIELPKFIKGQRNINSDTEWNNYKNAVNKYNPQRVIDIFREIFSQE